MPGINDIGKPPMPHIAVIMDGNGRWAKKRMLARTAGHAAGSENFRRIATHCAKIGVKYLTVYAFSTENWKRPLDEVSAIMSLLKKYLIEAVETLKKDNIGLYFFGDRDGLSRDVLELIEKTDQISKSTDGLKIGVCLNYGGRREITSAARLIADDVLAGKLHTEDINEDLLTQKMYTNKFPDPDLIIRTGGEKRLSNFLLWQCAYSEIFFSDTLWPDFSAEELDSIIKDYFSRTRRFGGI